MQNYVALWIGNDGRIGRTILCTCWSAAIAWCKVLSRENQEEMTPEQLKTLDEIGEWRFASGGAVYIGGLEEPE